MVTCDEPKQGEHWADSVWIVFNPDWPSGDGPYLVLCLGCDECLEDE